MRPGERLTIRSGHRLEPLWALLQARLPGEHAWAFVADGPQRWEAEVTRRNGR
jgi:uncharacterized protein (DUF2249 family)